MEKYILLMSVLYIGWCCGYAPKLPTQVPLAFKTLEFHSRLREIIIPVTFNSCSTYFDMVLQCFTLSFINICGIIGIFQQVIWKRISRTGTWLEQTSISIDVVSLQQQLHLYYNDEVTWHGWGCWISVIFNKEISVY